MRILLLDSQTFTLSGVKSLIKQEFPSAICDTIQHADQLLKKLNESRYSLVITDINMPGENMMAVIELVLAKIPSQKIMVHTSFPDYLFAKRLLQMGARGYINKSETSESFMLAMRNILNGQYYLSNQLVQKSLLGYSQQAIDNPFERLTHREREVCFLIIKGYRLREMADMMHLQKSTIGTHQSRILGKLGLQKTFEIRELAAAYSIPIYE
jgi:two-component system, NarL family, invasion response regulator UvrY